MPDKTYATGREICRFAEYVTTEGLRFDNEGAQRLHDDAFNLLLEFDTSYALADLGDLRKGDDPAPLFLPAVFNAWRERIRKTDPRRTNRKYPRGYAADLLRTSGPQVRVQHHSLPRNQPLLGEGDVESVVRVLARALEVPEFELFEKLADYYLEHGESVVDDAVTNLPDKEE